MKNMLAMCADWVKNSIRSPWFWVFALFMSMYAVLGVSSYLVGGVVIFLLWKAREIVFALMLLCSLP